MIKFENGESVGIGAAVRGMRNPYNSWGKADSAGEEIGDCDIKLAMTLSELGPVHAKYRRMMIVYVDITAPLYWWKEFDTYKVGTVANSCSTMHTITKKEFSIDDFSHEHLEDFGGNFQKSLEDMIGALNRARGLYLATKDKKYWWQIIQLLPSSYNQKRTVMLNYEVACNIYHNRKNHKLDEWRTFCDWIECLPYHELVTLEREEN